MDTCLDGFRRSHTDEVHFVTANCTEQEAAARELSFRYVSCFSKLIHITCMNDSAKERYAILFLHIFHQIAQFILGLLLFQAVEFTLQIFHLCQRLFDLFCKLFRFTLQESRCLAEKCSVLLHVFIGGFPRDSFDTSNT